MNSGHFYIHTYFFPYGTKAQLRPSAYPYKNAFSQQPTSLFKRGCVPCPRTRELCLGATFSSRLAPPNQTSGHLHSGALQKHRNNAGKHNGSFNRHTAVTFAVRAMRLFTTPSPLYSATGSYSRAFNAEPCNSKEPSDSVARRPSLALRLSWRHCARPPQSYDPLSSFKTARVFFQCHTCERRELKDVVRRRERRENFNLAHW